MLFPACGDDGGGTGTTDGGGGNDAAPQDTAPTPNCTPLDLASAQAVTIMNGQVTPNPQGGSVSSATYKLTSVKLDASGINVSGTAKSRVEFVSGGATSGAARVALIIDATALGMPVEQDVSGGGLYTLQGTNLNVMDGCGGTNPLPALTYTAAATSLTLWTNYMVTDPIQLTIPIELLYAAE